MGGAVEGAALLAAGALLALWVIYSIGCRRAPPPAAQAAAFHSAMVLCVLAAFGPLDELAEDSASAHMGQHMLFIVVVAPLWVIGRPLPQFAAVIGRDGARIWRPALRFVQRPMSAAYLHAGVIWFWHIPSFYTLALANPWWHVVEHALFLVSAGLFWWATLRSGRSGAPGALMALLFTLLHTGILGALLTFATTTLYGADRSLQDQQLAGLLMWVLGAFPYLIASAWCMHRWYGQLGRQFN